MTLHYTLLDVLAAKLGVFLSDLRYLGPAQKDRMYRILTQADGEEVPLDEWNQALSYIAELPPAPDYRTARLRLLDWLKEENVRQGKGI